MRIKELQMKNNEWNLAAVSGARLLFHISFLKTKSNENMHHLQNINVLFMLSFPLLVNYSYTRHRIVKVLNLIVMLSMAMKLLTHFKLEQNKIWREAFYKCKTGLESLYSEAKSHFVYRQRSLMVVQLNSPNVHTSNRTSMSSLSTVEFPGTQCPSHHVIPIILIFIF